MKTVECECGLSVRNKETGQYGIIVKVDRDAETIGIQLSHSGNPEPIRILDGCIPVSLTTWPANWERA